MFRANQFRAKMAENEKTTREVATAIGVNEATLYRKISEKSDFTRNEIQLIRQFLGLNAEEVESIFLPINLRIRKNRKEAPNGANRVDCAGNGQIPGDWGK